MHFIHVCPELNRIERLGGKVTTMREKERERESSKSGVVQEWIELHHTHTKISIQKPFHQRRTIC